MSDYSYSYSYYADVYIAASCFSLMQAYRWEDNVAVVEWLSQQLAEDGWEQSFLCENIRCVQRDHIMQRMRS